MELKIVLFLHHQKHTTMSTYKLKDGRSLEIIQDQDPMNPRTEFDNMGTMVCFHKRYVMGDKHNYKHENFAGWEDMRKKLTNKLKLAVILPIYMYDHSGVTISTKPFSCPWDSGQIGFIYVTKTSVREEYKVSRMSKKVIENVTKCLLAEVETYDQYLTGDVWGYKLYNENGEEGDSCWGFFGDDVKKNGILDNVNGELVEG
jgi:hypothetical protein